VFVGLFFFFLPSLIDRRSGIKEKGRSMTTIYSKDGCKFCTLAKEFMKEQEIPFEETKLDPESEGYAAERQRLIDAANGHKTFPWIFVGEEFIGGFSELQIAFNTQKLHRLLAAVGVTIEEPSF